MADSRELLEMLSFNEEKIMELYWLYEKKFPASSKMWAKLAEEEKTHANLLKSFALLTDDKDLSADLDRISVDEVKQSLKMLRQEIEKASDTEIDENYAASTALKIERTMIEKNILSVFDSKDKDFKKLFSKIEDDTKMHFALIKKLAETAK